MPATPDIPDLTPPSVSSDPKFSIVTEPLPPPAEGARPPLSERPEAVYLAALAASGRSSMLARLRTVADVLGAPSVEAVPWERLRYAHVAAIRAALKERELAP